jgi:hypothetical protein
VSNTQNEQKNMMANPQNGCPDPYSRYPSSYSHAVEQFNHPTTRKAMARKKLRAEDCIFGGAL